MKHLASIQKQFAAFAKDFNIIKMAIDNDWWKKLTPEQQKQYILEHRRTKLRLVNGPRNLSNTDLILSSMPKPWKKSLIYKGIGKNSPTVQLPDMLRSNLLKSTFDDNTKVKAIIGFKRGTPTTDMKPEFMITKCDFEKDKFNCQVLQKAGHPVNPDSYESYLAKDKDSYSRRRGYQKYQIRDIRMSAIVEQLPDEPYTILAIEFDPERIQSKQMKSALNESSSRREIEGKLVAKAVKPIYDYYSAKIQTNIDDLKNYAVPTFDDVLNDRKTNNAVTTDAMKNLKIYSDKLNSLSSNISYVTKWGDHLPYRDEPYLSKNTNSERVKENIHSFLRKVKELKDDNQEDYEKAVGFKIRSALSSIRNHNNFEDAADQMRDIGKDDVANKLNNMQKEYNNLVENSTHGNLSGGFSNSSLEILARKKQDAVNLQRMLLPNLSIPNGKIR